MPRTEKENERIREKRKNEILDAAIEVFAKKGYEKASCDDINKKVGCSHGLFYRYFKSKEDIYNALIAKYKELYLGKAVDIKKQEPNAVKCLWKIIGFFVELINRSKKDAYIVFIVLTSPMVPNKYNAFDKKLLDGLIELLKRVRFDNEYLGDQEALSLALIFYYMLIGMCYTKITFKDKVSNAYIDVENILKDFVSKL